MPFVREVFLLIVARFTYECEYKANEYVKTGFPNDLHNLKCVQLDATFPGLYSFLLKI